jgi:hypothetical protein
MVSMQRWTFSGVCSNGVNDVPNVSLTSRIRSPNWVTAWSNVPTTTLRR